MAGDEVTVVGPKSRQPTPQTPGMHREAAYADDDRWAGFVQTDSGMVSGWHHHDGWNTYIYVLDGKLRMEFGPGGSSSVEAGPGDFVHVPAHLVHREGNPADQTASLIVFRAGHGDIIVNTDGPEPA